MAERTQKPRFWIPSEFSQAVTMVVIVISAVVTVLWYFMAAAQELESHQEKLELAQIDLRQFTLAFQKDVDARLDSLEMRLENLEVDVSTILCLIRAGGDVVEMAKCSSS